MRTTISMTVFWPLLSLVTGSPVPQTDEGGLWNVNIDTSDREAIATKKIHQEFHKKADQFPRILSRDKNVTQPLNVSTQYEVTCGKPRLDKKTFNDANRYFKTWCDSNEGQASPFDHYYIDFGNVRIALCNWGLWNPCNGDELENAWDKINEKCPEEGEGSDTTVATGMWYEPAWRKGYWRGNCTTKDLCDGDVNFLGCRNEGEGVLITGLRKRKTGLSIR
ncbi:hypothetical protein PG993_012641 [Apiospora rasikravindrae]|uniref:Uncharacterized protein n=1 Tax=Apiospora rasikravindrae TaxID=990691 RepID=A0ABR1S4F1_9PEZI